MIHFPRLSSVRLSVQMQELSIGQAIAIAGYPDSSMEAANTLMLRSCALDLNIDPALWTIQERALAVGHYLMAINTESPDFPIGKEGKFTDYLQGSRDIDPSTVDMPFYLGEIDGDHWAMHHLYGYMVEAIERIEGLVQMQNSGAGQHQTLTGRLHWLFACMGAQLVRVQVNDKHEITGVIDTAPPHESIGEYDDWLIERVRIFSAWPDNHFSALYLMYRCGKEAQGHLFDWEFSIDGRPVFLPNPESRKGAAAELPPATFPVGTCISAAARDLGRKPKQVGS